MTLTLETIRTRGIREIEQEGLPLTELQRAILKAGVELYLDEDEVKVYKAEKLEEARRRWLRPHWKILTRLVAMISTVPEERIRGLLAWRQYTAWRVFQGRMLPVNGARFLAAGVTKETVVPPEGVAICERVAANLDRHAFATFEVEQLDSDPFMLVASEAEHYYLFAWDEKGFAPRRRPSPNGAAAV